MASPTIGRRTPLEAIEECGRIERTVDLRQSKLYGRSEEVRILRNGYHRVCRHRSELLLVKGPTGVGKTKLVDGALRHYVAENEVNKGFYAYGKCQPLHTVPYPVFVTALTDLVDCILESESDNERIRTSFNESFSDVEIIEIVRFIPNLGSIARKVPESRVQQPRDGGAIDFSLHHGYPPFILLYLSLIQFLVTCNRPVVMFLDDIQNIDGDSLKLLNAIIEDETLTNLLLICATTRCEDALSDNILSRDASLPISEILVGDLSIQDISAILTQDLLLEDTSSLVEEIVKKASGNMLYVMQFMEMLRSENLLDAAADGSLICCLDNVKEDTNIYKSLDNLLDFKIQRLGNTVTDIMTVASCLGPQFHCDTLVYVCRALDNQSWDDTVLRVDKALLVAIRLGYLEESDRQYSFVRDCYRERWSMMMCDSPAIHLQIGMALRSRMLIEQDSSLLLLAANNVMLGLSQARNKAFVTHAIDLLYRASGSATNQRSLVLAKTLAEASIRLLGDDTKHWIHQYCISVNVYNVLAAIEMMQCNYDDAYSAAREFLLHSANSVDAIRARVLVMLCLTSSGRYAEAKEYGFDALRGLQEPIAQSNLLIHFLREEAHVKNLLRGKDNEDLASLPIMRSSNKIAAMQLLGCLLRPSFLSVKGKTDGIRFCLIVLRMMTLSLTNGLCNDSCLGFACFGMYLCRRGKCNDGVRFGRLALQLVNRLGAKEVEAKVQFFVQAFVLHFQQPWLGFRDVLRNRVYPQQLGKGDLNAAFCQGSLLIIAASFSDTPLSSVEKEIAQYIKLMKHFGSNGLFNLSVFTWQRVHNLMGLVDDPVILTGSVMEEDATLSALRESSQIAALAGIFNTKLSLALLFESWTTVATLIPVVKRYNGTIDGHISQYATYFQLAVASCALYRITRHRKYRRSAAKATKRIVQWKADGVVVCEPMVTFIEAEWALTSGTSPKVPQLFMAAARGFASLKTLVQYQGMSYERIGLFFETLGNIEASKHYNSIALSTYEKWEAFGKVRDMQLRLSHEFRSPIVGKSDISTISRTWRETRNLSKSTAMLSLHSSSQFLERHGDLQSSSQFLERYGDLQASSQLLEKHEDLQSSSQLLEKHGGLQSSSQLLDKTGDLSSQ